MIFRTDANTKIGRGHLSRCIAIAEMLCDDFDILFVSHKENGMYIENLTLQYQLETIKSDTDFFSMVNHKDIVWLDGYSFNEDFKANLRSRVYMLAETNDLPYKVQNVDILFNHTPAINDKQFDVVEPNTTLYLGLDYALLRKAFLEKAKNNQVCLGGSGIFICFGGSDTFDLGLRFVQGLIENQFEDPIYWVSDKLKDELPKLSENIRLLRGLSQYEMIEYMSKSKILLIPSSVLSFEAIALRRPIYSGYFTENQKLIAKGLKKEGLAEGCRNLQTNKEFKIAFNELLLFYFDESKHKELQAKQMNSIDGNSRDRIKKIFLKIK